VFSGNAASIAPIEPAVVAVVVLRTAQQVAAAVETDVEVVAAVPIAVKKVLMARRAWST
jgi:hypothetical protein